MGRTLQLSSSPYMLTETNLNLGSSYVRFPHLNP